MTPGPLFDLARARIGQVNMVAECDGTCDGDGSVEFCCHGHGPRAQAREIFFSRAMSQPQVLSSPTIASPLLSTGQPVPGSHIA